MLNVKSLTPFSGGLLKIGQRVFSVLYGGRYGIIDSISGEQSPFTCHSVQNGC